MKTKSIRKDKVNVVTLGCSKNMVDSEVLLMQLQENNFEVEHDSEEEDANIILVVRNPYSWFTSFRDFCNTKSTIRTNKISPKITEAISLWNDFYGKYTGYKNKNVFISKMFYVFFNSIVKITNFFY